MTTATEQSRWYSTTGTERSGEPYGSTQSANRRWTDTQQSYQNQTERRAKGLGWFSIGLGLAQIGAPRSLARFIGINDSDETRNTMFALGLREITSGIGILSRPRPTGWIWSRVGGDIMDLALLGKALNSDENDKGRVAAATAAVVGVTVVDFLTGQRLSKETNGGRFISSM